MIVNLLVSFFKSSGRNAVLMEHKTDEQLILLYKKTSNKRYVRLLMRRYADLLLSCSISYHRNEQDVKDFAQELFIKLCDKLLVHDIENFRNWLLMVIKNHKLDNVKKEQHKRRYLQYIIKKEPEHDVSLLYKFNYESVHLALDKLSEQEKVCIEAVYFEEKNYDEIMKTQNWTFNQVRGYRDRGIKKLRKILNNQT